MVHQNNQFTHYCSQGDLGRLTSGAQPLVKPFEVRVGTGGHQSGHIECASDGSPTTADGTASVPLSTFSGMWSQTCQCGDLTTIESSQFRQFGQYRTSRDSSHPFNGLQLLHTLSQQRLLGVQLLKLSLDLLQIFFQTAHQTLCLAAQGWQRQTLGLLTLCNQHLQQLNAATDQFGQLLFHCRTRRCSLGSEGLAVGTQGGRIDGIGLGALALGASEKADACRIKDTDRNGGLMQRVDEISLVTAGGFTDHVNSCELSQEFEQSAMAGGGIGQVVETTGQMKLQVKLGNIQARVDSSHSVLAHSCKYELALEGRSINGSSLGHRNERFWLPTRLGKTQRQRATNSSAPRPSRLQAGRPFHLPIQLTPDKDRRKRRYKRAGVRESNSPAKPLIKNNNSGVFNTLKSYRNGHGNGSRLRSHFAHFVSNTSRARLHKAREGPGRLRKPPEAFLPPPRPVSRKSCQPPTIPVKRRQARSRGLENFLRALPILRLCVF